MVETIYIVPMVVAAVIAILIIIYVIIELIKGKKKKVEKKEEIKDFQPKTPSPIKADDLEKPLFQIEKQQGVPEIPDFKDSADINIKYPLIPPYCFAHIYWDPNETELVYKIEEPELNKEEKNILKLLESGIRELINLSFINVKDQDTILLYLEKNVRVLMTELSIEVTKSSFLKLIYYIYRDFVGLNELEPLMNDYYIEDVECNGVKSPVYIVHRKFRNIRTNLIYDEIPKLASFVEKLAQKSGKHVSYAEPLLDSSLPDGSRVNATYTQDITSKGPSFCFADGYLQLGTGEVVKIDEFFNYAKDNFETELKDGNEIIKLNSLNCIGVNDTTLEQNFSKLKTVIKLSPPEKLVEIELGDGTSIKVTMNHLFHIYDSDLKTIEAKSLKKNMLVPVPINVKVEGYQQIINIYDLLKEFSYSHKICIASNLQIKSLAREIFQNNSRSQICEKFGTHGAYFYEIVSKGSSISFEILDKILKEKEISFETLDQIRIIVYGGGKKGSEKSMMAPYVLDEELAYLVGAIISDGNLTKFQVNIATFNEEFKKEVVRIFNKKFKSSKEYYDGNRVYLCNKFASFYFNRAFGIPYGEKSHKVRIPKIIFKSNNAVVCGFIKGLFDGDGSCKSGLSYKTNSKRLAEELTFLLSRIGIFSYLRRDNKENRVVIPSLYEKIFLKKIGFNHSTKKNDLLDLQDKKKLNREYQRHGRVPVKPFLEQMKKLGLSKNYIIQKTGVSYNRLIYYDTIAKPFAKKILSLMRDKSSEKEIAKLEWILNSNQEFTRVKKVELIENKNKLPVYDIELEPEKFFIAGNKPINMFDTIRKFTKEPWSPVQLMEKGSVSAEALAYVWMLIEHERSFMVIGGTGSGKTSFLNCIAFFLPPQDRIVSIEDTRELALEHENWLPSVSRAGVGLSNLVGEKYGEVSLFDLLKEAFRQRPDYIIVGEIRGKEAFVLMQGISSGHPSYGTMHAESAETMVKRLQTPPISLSGSLIEGLSAVCVMKQTLVKGKPARKLTSVDELLEVKENLGGVRTNNVIKWDPKTNKFLFNPKSKAIYDISVQYGKSTGELLMELNKRTMLLNALYHKRIVGFKEVQKIIHQYYKDHDGVLRKFGIK